DLSAAVGTPAAHLAGPQPAIAGELIDAGERGDLDRHPLRVPALAVAELTGTPAPRGLAIEREGAALPEVEVELRGSQIDELGRSIAADQIADAELPLIVVAPAVDRARLRQRAGKVVVGLDLHDRPGLVEADHRARLGHRIRQARPDTEDVEAVEPPARHSTALERAGVVHAWGDHGQAGDRCGCQRGLASFGLGWLRLGRLDRALVRLRQLTAARRARSEREQQQQA